MPPAAIVARGPGHEVTCAGWIVALEGFVRGLVKSPQMSMSSLVSK
jgi:hypothetical protein